MSPDLRDRDEFADRLRDGRSEPPIATVCSPVVEYTREFQRRAAEEIVLLPAQRAITEMLTDYAVLRAQIRASQHGG